MCAGSRTCLDCLRGCQRSSLCCSPVLQPHPVGKSLHQGGPYAGAAQIQGPQLTHPGDEVSCLGVADLGHILQIQAAQARKL